MNKFRFIQILFSVLLLSGCNLFMNGEDSTTWTVLIYSSGDNRNNENLDPYIYYDFQEMERARVNDKLTVLLLIDLSSNNSFSSPIAVNTFTDTRLYKIEYDSTSRTDNADYSVISSQELGSSELGLTVESVEELDLADPQVLTSFVTWGKESYPADHYALIMEGHGDGWYEEPPVESRDVSTLGVSLDYTYVDDTGAQQTGYDSLSPREIRNALMGTPVDIIGFDACLMGNVETLYELRSVADYAWANPYPVPGMGNEYSYLLEWLSDHRSNPRNFGLAYLRAYENYYRVYSDINLSWVGLYDLNQLGAFVESEAFAQWNQLVFDKLALTSSVSADSLALIDDIKASETDFPLNNDYHYRNLWELYQWADNGSLEPLTPGAFMVNSSSISVFANSPEYHIGIYFPRTSESSTLTEDWSDYENLELAQNTQWDQHLQDYLAP